jgi:hypothetical protein
MGPISSVRPAVQWPGTSPQAAAEQSSGGLAASARGARADEAAASIIARPVRQAPGVAEAADNLAEDSYQIEAARARAEAAQRAYAMVSLIAGQNPLTDPAP